MKRPPLVFRTDFFWVCALGILWILNLYLVHGMFYGAKTLETLLKKTEILHVLTKKSERLLARKTLLKTHVRLLEATIDRDLLEHQTWSTLGTLDPNDVLVPMDGPQEQDLDVL